MTLASAVSGQEIENGGFEMPAVDEDVALSFERLNARGGVDLGWDLLQRRADVRWVRPTGFDDGLPRAPEGDQYVVIKELGSERPVIFEQVIDVAETQTRGPRSFELSFQAGRPEAEPMAVASALIIMLEPGSTRAKRSTGVNLIGEVDEGEFQERSVRFTLPDDVRQDRFHVRFVVRGVDNWVSRFNPPGRQRLLIDDVRLAIVYD
jgi:hypothetical protein